MSVKENAADAAQRDKLDCQRRLSGKSRICDIVLSAVFCLIIFGAAVLHLLMPDRDISDMENRELEKFPDFSAETLFSGKFTSDMTKYLSDQFPFRDFFVAVKAESERFMLRMENGGVMFHGNSLTARNDRPNEQNLEKNITSAAGFARALDLRGIPSVLAIAGRRVDVCTGDLPPFYGTGNQDDLWEKSDEYAACFPGVYLNLRDPLRAASESGEKVYYRTDHHWNTYGAYLAYLEVWKCLPAKLTDGITPLSLYEITPETVTDEFYGTSYSSAGAVWISPDSIELYRYDGDDSITVRNFDTGDVYSGMYRREFLEVRDKYSVFLGENAGRIDIEREAGDRGTILVIKDSFAQCLVPFLARDFNIVMIDPRYFSDSVYRTALDIEPDAVLVLMNIDTLTSSPVLRPLMRGVE